jgi:uncharacterized protein YggE
MSDAPVPPTTSGALAWARSIPRPVAIAAAALAAILAVAALAGGVATAVASRGAGAGVSATVVPARADAQTGQATAAGAGDTRSAAQPQVQSSGTSVSSPIVVGPSCAAAPTVQVQGRGLVATGVAPVTASGPATSQLSVSIQERGADAASVIAGAQAKSQAVAAALRQAGVPPSAIQQSAFSSFGDGQGRQFSASVTVQAQVPADQLDQVTKAIVQVGGITGYSTTSSLAAQPSDQDVHAAVAAASSQAGEMAAASARAAGVTLGAVQAVTTQPPTVCYGAPGAARVVQVTVTYALR